MKVTHIDHDEWTEKRFEPDDPSTGNGKADSASAKADAWPTLSSTAYHGLAGKVVSAILPHTESDPVALLLQYLVSFGNIVGRQPYYSVEGAEHYPVLYALLAGPTAKARKGTSAQRIRRVISIADPDWARNSVASGISSGEGILHAIRDPIFSMDKKTGAEVLSDPGIADKRLLLDEREFSAALDSMKREGNVVSRIIRDAWDCPEVLRTLTKHSPTKVTQPHISITGHITIEELQQKLDQTSMASGFANRFLFACIRRSKILPHGGNLDEDSIGLLGAATMEAFTIARTFTRITMTPMAAEMWVEAYKQLSKDVPGLLGAIIARGDAQTLRLALLYALLDQAQQIDKVHLEAALALWTFCEASARYIFGDVTGEPLADSILRALRTSGAAGMTRTNINNHFGGHVAAAKIQAALGKLLAAGKVRRDVKKANGFGRPTETWFMI
jgi:hypothetical protein